MNKLSVIYQMLWALTIVKSIYPFIKCQEYKYNLEKNDVAEFLHYFQTFYTQNL